MFFLLYFGLSKVWHVSSVPFFFFFFSLQTGFSSFGALLCFLSETQKIVAAPPEKKGTHGEKRNKVFLHFPPFVLPCVLLTRLLLLPRKERERERVMKSQSDCFFPPSPFSPCQWKKRSKGRKREEVTGGGRRKKRHCDARGGVDPW